MCEKNVRTGALRYSEEEVDGSLHPDTLAVLIGILVNNNRLTDLRTHMNSQFEAVNHRFDAMDQRFSA
jgi:hypothetical protein